MKQRVLVLFLMVGLLVSCAETVVKPDAPFELSGRDYLYEKTSWHLKGRIAVVDKDNSFSAAISWKHQYEQDQIELVGPLGQGRTQIILSEQAVVIDYGDERVRYSGNVDEVVSAQLGVFVPVSSLRYWVLGLVQPTVQYKSFSNGFFQSGWKVRYQQMQLVGLDELPRKIKVEQQETKLKLIVDEWQI